MNKGIIFGIGFLAGAISGGVATYFVTKEKIANDAADIIDQYAEHCEERIRALTGKEGSTEEEEIDETSDETSETGH